MADTVKCLNSVPSYKGNKCKEYKWISAFLKLKKLVKKIKAKKRGSVKSSAKRDQLA